MSKQGGAPAAAAAPAASPPAQTVVSGIQPPRRAIAPQLSEEPKGVNPVKELQQRQDAAMRKFATGQQQAEDAGAREGAPPPPKEATRSAAAATGNGPGASGAAGSKGAPSSPKPGTPAGGKTADGAGESDDGDGAAGVGDDAGDASSGGDSAASRSRSPRYEVQAMRKWAEDHPEEAALIRDKVFALPADQNQTWIQLKNKQRKNRQQLHEEHTAKMADVQKLADQAAADKAEMLGAAEKLGPIGDLWSAVAEPVKENPEAPKIDFDAGDAAFQENTGISVDDYMRLRARARMGGGGPEAARLRVELAKERRKAALAPAAKPPAKEVAKPEAEEPAAPAAGKQRAPQHDWSGEIDGKHKIRQLDGWQLKLDDEMRKFYDADSRDYDEDPEKAADRVLKREIEAMAAEFEDEAPPPPRKVGKQPPPAPPKPKRKPESGAIPSAAELTPNQDADDRNHPVIQKFEKRQKWALDRAMRAARGEHVEGYE